MNNYNETHFLDYLEDKLSATDKAAFDKELRESSELATALAEYKIVLQLESHIAETKHELAPGFAVRVMENIEENDSSFLMRLIKMNNKLTKMIVPATALAVVCIAVVINKDDAANVPVATKTPAKQEKQDVRKDSSKTLGEQAQFATTGDSNEGGRREKKKEQEEPRVFNKLEADLAMHDRVAPIAKGPAESYRPPVAEQMAIAPSSAPEMKQRLANSRAYDVSSAPRQRRDLIARPPHIIPPMPAEQNRETYGDYDENPRLQVASTPLSTFSIDVDTGSYTNSRRFLNMGKLPPKDAVRIEEFINYFDYNYPSQTKEPFAFYYEVAPSPLDKERYLLKVGIKAKDAMRDESVGRNLVFLVDVSGSMNSEHKLPLVKRALRVLTNNLNDNDKIAIVTYAGSSGVALDSTSGKDKQKILSVLDGLRAGGGTHGSSGINLAYQIAAKNFIKDGTNRVILATDGDFNVGISSFDALIDLIEEKRKTGISLTTAGFGSGNYQEKNLEQLANKGNGNYFYIDSFREARKVFGEQLGANMETVAKDVKLQIEFNPAHVKEYRLVGYDNRRLKDEDFANDKVDAGEIGSGHTVTVLYELVLTDSALAKKLDTNLRYQDKKEKEEVVPAKKTNELAFLKIRYKKPQGDTSKLLELPLKADHVLSNADKASDSFRFAAAVSYFATKLRDSKYAGDYSYNDIAELAKGASKHDPEGSKQELITLIKNAAAVK